MCVSRKHLESLVTQQLCKLNTARFVPQLGLYYAITPFSNGRGRNQWSPFCFPARSNDLLFPHHSRFLFVAFFFILSSQTLIHNLCHLHFWESRLYKRCVFTHLSKQTVLVLHIEFTVHVCPEKEFSFSSKATISVFCWCWDHWVYNYRNGLGGRKIILEGIFVPAEYYLN